MNEFKFSCPSCKQHIKISVEFESRRLDCPSCKTTLIVPPPPADQTIVPIATLAQPAARPKPTATLPPVSATAAPKPIPTAPIAPKPTTPTNLAPAPTKPAAPAASEAVASLSDDETDESGNSGAAKSVSTVDRISDTRVAVLTPQIKLEIVRAIRLRLADKSRWLPGKKEAGQYNYAAREDGGKLVPVSPTDASATHISLFGAVLLEFHRRNVMRVTTGRQQFLDQELTEAIQQVLGRQPGAGPVSEEEREALTHEQCLAVLDVLERRYQHEGEALQKRDVERKIESIRLADLVKKLETSAPVRAEEVACALYYELEEFKQRLEKIERSVGGK